MAKKITTYVDTSVIYPEVRKNPYSIYSFLLVAGYLKVAATYSQNDGNFMCDVAIPNNLVVSSRLSKCFPWPLAEFP